MEKFVEQTLLYDFYGELLSEHQRNIYKDVIFNDLSLSEIADEYGISRQGVHDIILYVYMKINCIWLKSFYRQKKSFVR